MTLDDLIHNTPYDYGEVVKCYKKTLNYLIDDGFSKKTVVHYYGLMVDYNSLQDKPDDFAEIEKKLIDYLML